MNTRSQVVAVIGNGILPSDDPRLALAEAVGAALAKAGFAVLTGGHGGIMAAASKGAAKANGTVIGLLPESNLMAANPWVTIPIPTGLGPARNAVVAHAPALVAIGGGAGTLAELALGWQLGRRLIALRVDGWSGQLADTSLDDQLREEILGADSADDVLECLARTRMHA